MNKKLYARVKWKNDMTFEGQIAGHTLTFDGYGLKGASPMEVLLASVGVCTAMLLKQALKAMHQEHSGLEIELEADKADEPPEVFTKVQMRIGVKGEVDLKNLERAINLVEQKYCGATVMIQKGGVEISNTALVAKEP